MPLKKILLSAISFSACFSVVEASPQPRICMFAPGAVISIERYPNVYGEFFSLVEKAEQTFARAPEGSATGENNRFREAFEVSNNSMNSLPSQSVVSETTSLTQDHCFTALKKYPDAECLVIRENEQGAITALEAPSPWFSYHLTWNPHENGQAVTALHNYLTKTYGEEIAHQAIPFSEERVKIGFPLTSAALRHMLLYAHLLSGSEHRFSHMIGPDFLPHAKNRALYEATSIQANYVAQAAREKAERIEQEANQRVNSMTQKAILNPSPALKASCSLRIHQVSQEAEEKVSDALREAILAADRAMEARMNLLLLDQPQQQPMYLGAKYSDGEELDYDTDSLTDSSSTEGSPLLSKGDKGNQQNYGSVTK